MVLQFLAFPKTAAYSITDRVATETAFAYLCFVSGEALLAGHLVGLALAGLSLNRVVALVPLRMCI